MMGGISTSGAVFGLVRIDRRHSPSVISRVIFHRRNQRIAVSSSHRALPRPGCLTPRSCGKGPDQQLAKTEVDFVTRAIQAGASDLRTGGPIALSRMPGSG